MSTEQFNGITRLIDVERYLPNLKVEVIGKGAIANLRSPDFRYDVVAGYELHLNEADITQSWSAFGDIKGKIRGAHHVTFLTWGTRKRQADLAAEDGFEDQSDVAIANAIDLVAGLGGDYLAVHPAVVMPSEVIKLEDSVESQLKSYSLAKSAAVTRAAVKMNQILAYAENQNVTIALETDAAWVWKVFEQGVIDTPEHMRQFLVLCPKAKVIIDEEHVARAAIFNHFLPQYLEMRKTLKGDEELAGREWLMMLRDEMKKEGAIKMMKTQVVDPYMRQMIKAAKGKIIGIHSCGWDMRVDGQNVDQNPERTSRRDAHLPPRRVVARYEDDETAIRMIDTIDHRATLEMIKQEGGFAPKRKPWVVLEYDRHLYQKRQYKLASEPNLIKQSSGREFAQSILGWVHLIRSATQ